jgi:HlyD family secretion protein
MINLEQDSKASSKSNRYDMDSQTKLGLWLTVGVLLFIFVWGSVAKVASAVIAQGRITLESSVKRVQHREGGIVGAINIKEGDLVRAGQLNRTGFAGGSKT